MGKTCDIYLPLDERDKPNEVVWPVALKQLKEIVKVVEKCGWTANVLNPDKPVSSVAEGLRVVKRSKGDRFLNFMAGWCYPDFTVSPMFQLPRELPKMMLGSAIPDFPGAVGLFAAASGTSHVGIKTDRCFAENFENHAEYADGVEQFLKTGSYERPYPKTVEIPVTDAQRAKAKTVREQLRGQVYGAFGPRSMQMWNKISEADFLRVFGIAREGFDQLRLVKAAEKIPDARAEAALNFLVEKGMDIRLGKDPLKELTREMALFQMKAYCALLDISQRYGLNFIGVQDQLDYIEHYPATDLTLGILNNRLRPEGSGETFVASTEADDGAAVTMQALKLLSGGEPAGFNDLRYWDAKQGLYWFVNSGSLAPYFAQGRHDTLKGAWSQRQTYMYFQQGGGTSSVVCRIPGVVTWARFSYRDNQMYLCAGRGITDVPTEEQWKQRSARCSPDWPHWYLKLCGRIEWKLNTNHPMTVCGDYLAELKALAGELGIPFECYDYRTPEEIKNGTSL